MATSKRPHAKGRGAQINPPNRFEVTHREDDFEQLEGDAEYLHGLSSIGTEYFPDNSQTIVTENDSPDVGFRYSVNPYRGCAHGCAYCYARPTHEYLGLNAGLDFESKIYVKLQAPQLLRQWLARESWEPELIAFSGVTDCYQPAERHYRLTRGCLEVALEARQPVGIVTKNALVRRDLDLLQQMASLHVVRVWLSITTLDEELARTMEPRTSPPSARFRTIEQLSRAGVPTTVMVAPVIPGLNDSEVPAILQAAADAGACSAGYILLRLPLTVRPVFLDWLQRTLPLKKDRIQSRIRSTRSGRLTDGEFGRRMRGTGELADQIQKTFQLFAKRFGLDRKLPPLDTSQFRSPLSHSRQLRLF